MLDNSALDNTRIPWPRLMGTALGVAITGVTLASLLPIGPGVGMAVVVALDACIGVVSLIAMGVILLDHFATVRTLRRGNLIAATVAHTKRTTWGLGTGGQSWHVRLRYEIDGRTIECERSVPQAVYERCHAGSQVEVRVLPASPRRWVMPEPATTQSSAPVLTIEQRRAQLPGLIAFAVLAVVLAVIGVASAFRVPQGLILSAILASASGWIAAKWRRGEGRLAGGCMIAFLVIYVGPWALTAALAPERTGLKLDAPTAVALIALAAAMTFATIVLVIDGRHRSRANAAVEA